jgi:molybdopterin adenylyltransferase
LDDVIGGRNALILVNNIVLGVVLQCIGLVAGHGPYRSGVFTVSCIVTSDRASSGTYQDQTGPTIRDYVQGDADAQFQHVVVVPDSAGEIQHALGDMITNGTQVVITAGGTGIARRDVTVDSVQALARTELDGFGHAMRQTSLDAGLATALLSRASAFVVQDTLVICLPGSPKAVAVCLDAVWPVVAHAVALLRAPSGADTHPTA